MALAGLIRRALKRQWPALDWAGLLVGLVWLGLLLAAAVRYSFSIYDIHGRLLYPGLAIIGALLVLGLSGWPRSKVVITIGLVIPIGLAVIAPLAIIQPAYARPIVSALPDRTIKSSAQFNGVELIGYQVKRERVKSDEPIDVVTYWRKTAAAGSSTGAVTLLSPGGQIAGRSEMLLGTDAYPVAVWQPAEIVATDFRVPAQVERPTVATVQLTVGDRSVDLGRVVVFVDRPCGIDRVADVTFGGSIKLTGYRIEDGAAPQVVLCWQAIQSTPVDYTVFVHVAHGSDTISGDAQPVSGNYPTSVWQPGDVIEDVHPLAAGSDLKIPHASVGLYRLDTGERLTIDGTTSTEFELTK